MQTLIFQKLVSKSFWRTLENIGYIGYIVLVKVGLKTS